MTTTGKLLLPLFLCLSLSSLGCLEDDEEGAGPRIGDHVTAENRGAASAGARCSGRASSCYSVGASSCWNQLGCTYNVGYTLSASDDECTGTPKACEDIRNEEHCTEQSGCSWK
jgi:hypothetical protein